MAVHVAEANEGRGRVIIRFSAWRPNEAAMCAAMIVAHAFHSEVEMLFVEDSQRVDFAGFPFAREIPRRGGAPRAVSPAAIKAEYRGCFAAARARAAMLASEAEVHVSEKFVNDDPVQALVSACAQRGPWNMIVIAETFDSLPLCSLDEVFEAVSDATGVILVGPLARSRRLVRSGEGATEAKPAAGPIVLVVEDTSRLESMLRAGRRIAAALEGSIVIQLVAGTVGELEQMEGEARLLLGNASDVRLERSNAAFDDRAAIAEVIRRRGAAFLIAQYGGIVVPRKASLRPLLGSLDCPLLLVR
jgi:hypothetical protein